jgi:thiol-disulfide isomerase/thioredoxin
MTRRLAAALLVMAALVAGCGETPAPRGDAAGAATTPARAAGPTLHEALVAADLPTCPAYSDGPVAGGLPDVELGCLGEGQPVHLAGLRGPAVVNLWASWCTTCRDEMPILDAVRSRAGERVAFLGVDFQDERVPGLQAAKVFGLRFPSTEDPDGDPRAALRVTGLPVTLFVRADGTVAGRKDGVITSEDELERLLADHLGVRL